MSEKKLTGTFYGTTREDEEKKLKRVIQVAEEKLNGIRQNAANLQEELKSLREVYDVEDKEGLAQWFNTDARFKEVRNDMRRAERAGKKPFFGRIDIEDDENGKRETFYIGKSVIAKNPSEPEVIDWRAPISSVYYDHSLGNCTYKVPKEGIFKVDLKRKRTYEIEEGNIKDYYDSDVVANDDLLTKYLSKSKRNVLSEIIATIQQEQNEVIRKNPKHNVLIQGSAGSGKTTVAMHRISYILYNYETEFKPDGFYIVGSNKVLLNYITGVLPDLDVYGVRQMTMEELFTRLLYEDWDRKKYKIRTFDKKEKSIGIKGTGEWFEKLKVFCKKTEWNHIPRENILIEKNGHLIMSRSDIEKVILEYPDWSMVRKFERMNDVLEGKLESELYGRHYSYNDEEQKKLLRKYSGYFNRFIWEGSVFDLYEEFVLKEMKDHPEIIYEKETPDLYDLASLAYIYKRIKESEVIQEASHVVIDEAQDFGMTIYHSLKYCMSKCTFTIMGDVSQNINFDCGLSDWEELKKVMLPDRYDYFGLLRKSYRNTVEISQFATDILRHGTFPIYPVEPIIRHGDEVDCIKAGDESELNDKVLNAVKEVLAKQYETIAVICKDISEAKEVYDYLSKHTKVKYFKGEDTEFTGGVYVIPIEYSKGLEFDAVIIYDASDKAYPSEDGYAKLLYVAATRALHELRVFYLGTLTKLVSGPIPEDRKNISFKEDDYHLTPYVFEEEFKTKEEVARAQALEGDGDRELRDKYGPKKIIVKPKAVIIEKKAASKGKADITVASKGIIKTFENEGQRSNVKTLDESEFGTMPATSSLKPVGHAKIDNAIRWINKDKNRVEIVGRYGTLIIIPVSDETVRVLFSKNDLEKIGDLPREIEKKASVRWLCADIRDAVEIRLEKLTVRVDKRTGAVMFVSKNGTPLMSENPALTRQYHGNADIWWEYFDWSKKEKLSARGEDETVWTDLSNTAKYISHTASSKKTALIMSAKGYQILIPGRIKTMVCTVPTYGPYICFEGSPYIDYIFRTAK
ncbi:MAG: ATP-binding domain-containing protein [Lachnospiraceae bacterium]|nr:ATP-binding domain-containing protein [Lachnospiraceae bacterium]